MRTYQIIVRGRISSRLASAFEPARLVPEQGRTVLIGEVDQAQLFGILDRLRDLGIELLGVEEVTAP